MNVTIRQKILVLKLARRRLQEGKQHYICLLLQNIGWNDRKYIPACEAMINYVRESLGKSTTLETWVQLQIGRHAFSHTDSLEMRLQTRRDWIDWMIAQLQDEYDNNHVGVPDM